MESSRQIKIDDLGIATVLKLRLVVPPNQREYSWEEEHVTELYDDLQRALDESQPPAYFLGTIALTGPAQNVPQVTDGQQRLATTMLLLAAIRDYFTEHDTGHLVKWIEQEYLTIVDPEEGEIPRLTLNIDDRKLFAAYVATHPNDSKRNIEAKRESHKRIQTAAGLASDRVQTIISAYTKDSDRVKRLRAWIDFLTNGAIVIVLRLPSDLNAFKMFETLNDRGLRTSQVDIVKNYLFSESSDKMMEIQPKWSKMMTILEGLDIDDVAIHFLRHFMMCKYGHLRKEEIFQRIESNVSGKKHAIDFVHELADGSEDYAAVLSPDHKKWNAYYPGIRASIRTIRVLQVAQIRPLMLAVATRFSKEEAAIAFRRFVSWTVRFLIAGGGRGQSLEDAYSKAAHSVGLGRITTFADLVSSLNDIIPRDPEFQEAFSVARVSKSYLARYYLRALELKNADEKEPEWIPNDDQVINLEHVLPENPGENWPDVDEDTAQSYYSRIGNQALLQASKNSIIGNSKFADKKPILYASTYALTKEVGAMNGWGPEEISERQKKLAELAVETWPIK